MYPEYKFKPRPRERRRSSMNPLGRPEFAYDPIDKSYVYAMDDDGNNFEFAGEDASLGEAIVLSDDSQGASVQSSSLIPLIPSFNLEYLRMNNNSYNNPLFAPILYNDNYGMTASSSFEDASGIYGN